MALDRDTIISDLGKSAGTNAATMVATIMGYGPIKCKKFSIPIGATLTEVDTGWDLPAKALLVDIFYEVTALQATVTIDIGVGLGTEVGFDANGFVAAGTVAALGLYRPGVITYGAANGWPATCTRGALLAEFTAGSATDDRGFYLEHPFVTDSVAAKSVGYTRSAEFTTATLDVYMLYIEV